MLGPLLPAVQCTSDVAMFGGVELGLGLTVLTECWCMGWCMVVFYVKTRMLDFLGRDPGLPFHCLFLLDQVFYHS